MTVPYILGVRREAAMAEREVIDYYLEMARQRDYPSLTLDEMREVFNETYERLAGKEQD